MHDDDPLEMSPLCQEMTVDGKSVRIEIYRGETGGWSLEIVDEFGNSTVWDDEFETDSEAFDEAQTSIRNEGIDAFIGMHL
ncbi:hypothetical protein JW992_00915 [candidate division KSB1 bacterium]|nr:hypothetical protein [candidate division KSB1 bacterium]